MKPDFSLHESRSELITVSSYEVSLDLTSAGSGFHSVTVVKFACHYPGASSFIDLTAVHIDEMTLNGVPVEMEAFDGNRIVLDELAAVNVLRVAARCSYSRCGRGLHRFSDPADGAVYLYSDLQTSDAHRVYACFDRPDMKASYLLTVTAPADWVVVSNMAAAQPLADIGGGTARWQFPATPPLPPHVTAVVAGRYHVVRGECDGVPLGVYCRKSLAAYLDVDEILQVTGQGLRFFGRMFGVAYPFGKYDQVFAPELAKGAMENAGCVTISESYIFRSQVTDFAREARAETILHELAHMWFGNLVSITSWDDLWLNESFAAWAGTLAQAEATRWATAWTTFAQTYKALGYRQDQMPSAHPLAADKQDTIPSGARFDGITYAKGASVLKQLAAYAGRDNFVAGLRIYLREHSWSSAALGDLLAEVQDASGRDLTAWSEQWLKTKGVNTLRPSFEVDRNGCFTSFAVIQEAAEPHTGLRTHRIAIGLYDNRGGVLMRRQQAEADVVGDCTAVPALAGQARPDLVLLNDDDLTYAKIRLDAHSLRTLLSVAVAFTDPLPAALCWAAAWDMCRDGDMAARDYVRLVAAGVELTAEASVMQTLLRQAMRAARRFTDPAARQDCLALLARKLRGLLHAAPAGSDAQLTYVRAFAAVASSSEDLALLEGLLEGSVAIPGLNADNRLRWMLLRTLVRQCVPGFGTAAIEAELAREVGDAGQQHAASCLASVPDPEAKKAAWKLMTSGEPEPAMFRARLSGFADPDRPELMAPYQEKYFTVLSDVWRTWPRPLAQDFATGVYLLCPVSAALAEATCDYIAGARPPMALQRLLADSRDEVLRALRCQARDREAGSRP